MNRVTCLICDKLINKICEYKDHFCLDGGGFIKIEFAYGSTHDQGSYNEPREEMNYLDKLLSCNIIQAYICDDCFKEKLLVIEGYDIQETIIEKKRIV